MEDPPTSAVITVRQPVLSINSLEVSELVQQTETKAVHRRM